MNNAKTIWSVVTIVTLIIAAVLFFVSINGYSLRDYYFGSQIERGLADLLLPGLATKKIFFWGCLIVGVIGEIIQFAIKDPDEKKEK